MFDDGWMGIKLHKSLQISRHGVVIVGIPIHEVIDWTIDRFPIQIELQIEQPHNLTDRLRIASISEQNYHYDALHSHTSTLAIIRMIVIIQAKARKPAWRLER